MPTIAMAAPELGDDGLLASAKIHGLKLDADWAVLSVCNTATTDRAGLEVVSGLGRDFFYADSMSIFVSIWPVHSYATPLLMTETFKIYAAGAAAGRAKAIQEPELNLIN